ncbi:MAG: glycogen phosphorylase [Firmicutes bacterium]|nr:glycogen phosphorylase [Bacillota bacterium]
MELNVDSFRDEFVTKAAQIHGKPLSETTDWERYQVLAILLREHIGQQLDVAKKQQKGQKKVYYLSIEFLLGRMLDMNLINLGIRDIAKTALAELGLSLEHLEEVEEDPGLGNGGLGRLAACYLDSMAAAGLAGNGSVIRYRYGFFEQDIVNGYQTEIPDDWLANGFNWEFRRRDEAVQVRFGGNVRAETNGKLRYYHENYESVLAVPYDVPILGYQNGIINTLRLWSAEPSPREYTCGLDGRDCRKVIADKQAVESISDVLYPDDSFYEGRVLRLKQQYFLVSASLQSIISSIKAEKKSLRNLADYVAIHINDTHPALAVPELMRILLDEEGFGWDEAWDITVNTLSYTNHTVLPEALEKWPVEMLSGLLPRIYIIINEINERFCKELWQRWPEEWQLIRSMAIVADNNVHMAHLAIVGCHSVNGVAKIHTEILKTKVMNSFYNFYPLKFNNKTNGVTHRRWLLKANLDLAGLISKTIGPEWIQYPCNLLELLRHDTDRGFQQQFKAIKHQHKEVLCRRIRQECGIKVDPDSIFDSHIKRIHGYKRQTLNVFHIMYLYNCLKNNPKLEMYPRTFIFAGKAAPGYYQAKKTIKLINSLADVINNDRSINDKIKVVFLDNYNVSLAELIIPASDVSEQIPTASREACGTGNMKFMMNGAITIGTLDGANIEMLNAVGKENIITFGLTADEVLNYYQNGGYYSREMYERDPRLKQILDQLVNGFFSSVGADEFRPLFDAFLNYNDEYFVLKDFDAYVDAQKQLESCYKNEQKWLSMCTHNIAHSGKFAGDRTFVEYAMDIWKLNPEHVKCYCATNDDFSNMRDGCKNLSNRRPKIPNLPKSAAGKENMLELN